MPYIAPVVAYVDGRGNFLCADHQDHGKGEMVPQYADNSAIYGCTCDVCHKLFTEEYRTLKVYVSSI